MNEKITDTSNYACYVSQYHKKLIKKALDVCNLLKVPISVGYTFKYKPRHIKSIAFCDIDTNTIFIDARLSERDFIETIIHELLHTIDNKNFSSHKGIWKKWANVITQNSEYFINEKYGSEIIVSYPVNSLLPEMSVEERHLHIKKYLDTNNFSIDKLISFIPYASKADTRNIIYAILLNFQIDNKLYLVLANSIRNDTDLFKQVAADYCKECFSKTIKTPESRYLFDMIFSLTDVYILVSEHTNQVLKY